MRTSVLRHMALIGLRNELKVKPHLRNLAKCSGASSRGNGLFTNVTSSCLSGKIAWSSLLGLRGSKQEFSSSKTSQVHVNAELTSCMPQKRLRPSDGTLYYVCRGDTSRICVFLRYNCCSSCEHKTLPNQCSQCFGLELTGLPSVSI